MAESTSVPSGWYPTAPPGPPPHRPSRRTPWVIAGVVALLVVVAVGVALVVKLTGNDAQHRPDGLLPMPFPTEPQREWTLQASDIAPGAAFGPIGLYSPEFRNYDGTLLVTVVDEGAGQPMSLAALDAADGTVLWTVPEVPFSVRSCATAAIDGLVPCIAADAGELRYYRISDGEVEHTEDLPGAAYVEVYRGSVYTAGRDADFQVGWMARGTVGDATSSWREEFDFGQCPGGDGSRFTVSQGIVTWIAGLHALAVTTDGVPLTPESRYDVVALPGNGAAAIECHGPDGLDGASSQTWTIADSAGATLREHVGEGRVASTLVVGNRANDLYFVGNTAYDITTGEEVWRASNAFSLQTVVGDVVLGSRDPNALAETMTAYDVASGDLLWTAPIPEFFLPLLFDGERVIGFTPEGYIAINTHTGERDWETGPLDGAGGLGPAGAGLAAISPTELVFFRPGR